jgi:hypothetical protein
MWFASFENSICDKEVEVATDTCRSEAKALPQNNGCRRAIFEN